MKINKIYILFFLILFLLLNSICSAEIVKGDTTTVDGKKILKVWGTHTERGYAYGYLMGENILDVFENYFLGVIFLNNSYLYSIVRNYFISNFEVEEKYDLEADAMIDGISDGGNSLYNNVLHRNIDEIDILLCNSLLDLDVLYGFSTNPFGCSSLSSWGESTINDPILNEEKIITRFLDWYPDPTLLENQLLVVNFPSEIDEQNWISFTFSGLFGALSAINEEGVASFLNVGNNPSHPYTQTFHPIFLTLRNGIESLDFNNDAECNPMDIVDAVLDKNRISDNIIHVISSVEKNDHALIIECNNENGVAVRDISDNTIIAGDNLAATNHFRLLYPAVYCGRYDHISDSLNFSLEISPERSWNIMSGAAGTSSNIQTIQFIPMNGTIKWSIAESGIPAYTLEPTVFSLEELLQNPIPAPENIIIFVENDSVFIEWDEVEGVTSYKVYSYSDPYIAFENWDFEVETSNTNWKEHVSEDKKFYYVVAVN